MTISGINTNSLSLKIVTPNPKNMQKKKKKIKRIQTNNWAKEFRINTLTCGEGIDTCCLVMCSVFTH